MKLSDKAYDILKWLCILGLPTLQTLYSTLAGIWGWPFADKIPQTFSAVGLAIGAFIGVSSANYKLNDNLKGSDSNAGNSTP